MVYGILQPYTASLLSRSQRLGEISSPSSVMTLSSMRTVFAGNVYSSTRSLCIARSSLRSTRLVTISLTSARYAAPSRRSSLRISRRVSSALRSSRRLICSRTAASSSGTGVLRRSLIASVSRSLVVADVVHDLQRALPCVGLAQPLVVAFGQTQVIDLIQQRAGFEQPMALIVHGFLQARQQMLGVRVDHGTLDEVVLCVGHQAASFSAMGIWRGSSELRIASRISASS